MSVGGPASPVRARHKRAAENVIEEIDHDHRHNRKADRPLMAQPLVTLSVEDGLATVTLARPEAGNAMSWDFIAALADSTQTIADDPTVRAVLIEAQGKNFCVGGDIRSFASESDPAGFICALAKRLHEGVLRLAQLPAPVVIAVQGAAAGAGLSLVAGGDIVIGARSSSYSMAYTGIGLTADGGATWLLPRLIGLRRAQELAYLGRRLNAEEAERFGLLTSVVDDDALVDEARAVARRIASGPTHAFGQVKRLLAEGELASLADHLDSEAEAIGVAMATQDAQGAIKSFLARQSPNFTGR